MSNLSSQAPDPGLQRLLSADKQIRSLADDLTRSYSLSSTRVWDERDQPHLGEGWLCEYVIYGLSTGAGLALSSFVKAYFSETGRSAWKKTVQLFSSLAAKLRRKKMVFFLSAPLGERKIFLVLDEKSLSDEEILEECNRVYGQLLQLALRNDELTTEYCPGSLLTMYDERCKDVMIYSVAFDLEQDSAALLATPFAWIITGHSEYDKKGHYTSLSNLCLVRGVFHRSLSDFAKAREWLEKALDLEPGNLDLYLEIGRTCLWAGAYGEAVTAWKELRRSSGYVATLGGLDSFVAEEIRDMAARRGSEIALKAAGAIQSLLDGGEQSQAS